MSRLLYAELTRLRKSKMFLACIGVMLGFGIMTPVSHVLDGKRLDYTLPLDDGFMSLGVLMAIVLAAFVSFFIGTEHSDGTIRNKIIVGHSKICVYLVQLITCMIGMLILCAVYIIVFIAVGMPMMGFFETEVKMLVSYIVCALLVSGAFTAIFTMVAMIIQNKSIIVLVCILSAFFSLFIGVYISSKLEEPKVYEGYTYSINGKTISEEEEINPNYVSGNARKVYEFLQDFIPGSQAVVLSRMEAKNPEKMSLYSCFVIFFVTLFGVLYFRKQDIK